MESHESDKHHRQQNTNHTNTQHTAPGGSTGSPGQGGNPLLTPELAKAHKDALHVGRLAAYKASLNAVNHATLNANTARYRSNYRLIIDHLTNLIISSSTIGSTTIYPPHSGHSHTMGGPTKAEQWNVPSSSSPSVFMEGREYILRGQDTGVTQAPSIHPAPTPLPYTQAQIAQAGSTPTLSQGKGKSTLSRHGKRKQEDQHAANVKAQADHNAQQVANQAAREIAHQQEQAQATYEV